MPSRRPTSALTQAPIQMPIQGEMPGRTIKNGVVLVMIAEV